jgi:hypothetical protein
MYYENLFKLNLFARFLFFYLLFDFLCHPFTINTSISFIDWLHAIEKVKLRDRINMDNLVHLENPPASQVVMF